MNISSKVRIRVIHADPITAAGLVAVFQNQVQVTVASAQPGEATEDFRDVDVILADYQNGIDAATRVTQMRAGRNANVPKVMIVTPIDREWEVRFAMSAGIRGYVLQGCSVDELVQGALMVSQGQRYLSQSVARRIADSMSREELTCREKDVLNLLTTGACNKSIARELGIAVGTVKAHLKSILEKLDAVSRTHAVIVASERGLIHRGGSAHPAAYEACASMWLIPQNAPLGSAH